MTRAEVERRDGIPIVRPRIDIDAAHAGPLREQLADCVDTGVHQLILDLSETRYVDSAGLDMLFRLAELMRQRRAGLVLVIPPESQLARLAEIVGLPHAMPVRATVEEALDEHPQHSEDGGPTAPVRKHPDGG